MGADRSRLDACFLTISAYAEDWHRLGLIFPNSLKTFLPVLDFTVSLAEVASGYSAMDQRQAIKALVRP